MIAKSLQGRTENSIKNRFYSAIRKIKSHGNMAVKVDRDKKDSANYDENGDNKIMSLISQMQQLETLLNSTRKEILSLENTIDNEEVYEYDGVGLEYFTQGLPQIYDFDMNTY